MAITLGDLRTFCRVMASPDDASANSNRRFMVWINAAVNRLLTEREWDRFKKRAFVNVPVRESLTTLFVVAGSRDIGVLSPALFAGKYVTEEWLLAIPQFPRIPFGISAITDSPTNRLAQLLPGQEWTGSTASGLSCSFHKVKYPLPDDAEHVYLIQSLTGGTQELLFLEPHVFDAEIGADTLSQNNAPCAYTIRNNRFELWPAPSTQPATLMVTYRKGRTLYADADADATEVDWDQNKQDLLRKAIQFEAALTQGQDSPIPIQEAKESFYAALKAYGGSDGTKPPRSGPMILPSGLPTGPGRRFSWTVTG